MNNEENIDFSDNDFNDPDYFSESEDFNDNDFIDNDDIQYNNLINTKSSAEIDKNSFLNMNFKKDNNGNYRVKSEYDMFCESFYFEPIMMYDGSKYDRFVAACELYIRNSLEYKAYISYLKNEVGLNHDAFNSDITDNMACLEMHHGPIFTLYDYVKIIIDYSFDKGLFVNTFLVAKRVMEEHACNRVQVVMLTKNNHALVHAGKLKVDFRQCHGSIKDFITIYKDYIIRSPNLLRKIAQYKSYIDNDQLHDTSFIQPDAILTWAIKEAA